MRMRRRRRSSRSPCSGDVGAAQRAVAEVVLLRALHVARGLFGAKNWRVRMAMWSSEVPRGRQVAFDSLKPTLN